MSGTGSAGRPGAGRVRFGIGIAASIDRGSHRPLIACSSPPAGVQPAQADEQIHVQAGHRVSNEIAADLDGGRLLCCRISRPFRGKTISQVVLPGNRGPAQGDAPMSGRRRGGRLGSWPSYPLHHRHQPDECGVVVASFNGRDSPLRR
ncbi:MAG TPA: hypothetical protein VGS19_25305 [Streptosporangiaceae bacterium]|nr:hypothetical protein [Streptosporangiaceae bacterium]